MFYSFFLSPQPKSNRHWAFVFFAFEAECETQMTIPCTESKSRVEALFKKVAGISKRKHKSLYKSHSVVQGNN